MKTFLLIASIFITQTFQQGWEDGYKRGYCSNDPFCISPVPPIAPIPMWGFNTYQDGYDRGVIKGKQDKDSTSRR